MKSAMASSNVGKSKGDLVIDVPSDCLHRTVKEVILVCYVCQPAKHQVHDPTELSSRTILLWG